MFLVNTLINIQRGIFKTLPVYKHVWWSENKLLEFFSVIQAVKKYFKQSGQVHLIRED